MVAASPTASTVSLRTIARAAGVSAMTVSRALRRDPKVTSHTQNRVQKIARELGYRPDPQVAKLMYHLRLRRKPVFQSSICALTNVSRMEMAPFARGVIAGARRRAEASGFAFNVVHLDAVPLSPGSLQRMLRSRGVEGVLLLPMAVPGAFSDLLDWSEFSTVATTLSVIAPEVHRVMPHHFRNMQQMSTELAARGYRRPGLVLHQDFVIRVNHAYNAAALWHSAWHGGEPVAPLIYTGEQPAELHTWLQRQKPDVIVTNTPRNAHLLAAELAPKLSRTVAVVLTSLPGTGTGFAGIDERCPEIGSAAVDLLTSLIQRGEKGLPDVPAFTLIQGRWVDGKSCPKRRLLKSAAALNCRNALIEWQTQ